VAISASFARAGGVTATCAMRRGPEWSQKGVAAHWAAAGRAGGGHRRHRESEGREGACLDPGVDLRTKDHADERSCGRKIMRMMGDSRWLSRAGRGRRLRGAARRQGRRRRRADLPRLDFAIVGRGHLRRARGHKPPPPFPSRTNWTSLVPPPYLLDKPRPSPVLTGQASSLPRTNWTRPPSRRRQAGSRSAGGGRAGRAPARRRRGRRVRRSASRARRGAGAAPTG